MSLNPELERNECLMYISLGAIFIASFLGLAAIIAFFIIEIIRNKSKTGE
jgi:hypothetical protein